MKYSCHITCAILSLSFFLNPVYAQSIDEQAYRGWGFLVHTLKERGMNTQDIEKIFLHKKMPRFSFVPFSIAPKEPTRRYAAFLSNKKQQTAKRYLKKYERYFTKSDKQFSIPKEVIAAILLVETNFGTYTGHSPILPRLARLANAGSPQNIKENYQHLLDDGEEVTEQQVQERGGYLLHLFLPEVEAAIRIARKRGFNPFSIKGSRAGAFGFAQFLPTSFERFARDGNLDGTTSLYQHADAILSVGSFLAHYIPQEGISEHSLRDAIHEYNRSEAYVNTIMTLSSKLGLRFSHK